MTKSKKLLFFFISLCAMTLLAVGSVQIDAHFTLAMVLLGIGLAVAAMGFVLKAAFRKRGLL
ncbi:hypothetical protein [Ferroacidibacillus organovorans]|uniref:YlaF family protein n=1 Tax=Ferroacidibacillus organovorans TaxID=1765683 RepID=A0A162UTL6_9BACL|nr:hypothetical protein [Ferroacidibacillus organovorans]KYP82035.1 hypothetical protein AYJ22_04860 [Ferroacidibacillus organovorans]OAG94355.1 hypothetical protein AYW79_05680 [Ferroacidibacillus organovorans]OPG15248.1 hypothetical protein B2M26_12315 [Ferroacidibacillus organovorans]